MKIISIILCLILAIAFSESAFAKADDLKSLCAKYGLDEIPTSVPLNMDSMGIYRARKGKKWGYIRRGGPMLTPVKYDFADYFAYVSQGNRALVRANNKWGFIDEKGTEVVPLVYDSAVSFLNSKDRDYAKVSLDGRTFFIDQYGIEFDPLHPSIDCSSKSSADLPSGEILLQVLCNGKFGLAVEKDELNRDGKIKERIKWGRYKSHQLRMVVLANYDAAYGIMTFRKGDSKLYLIKVVQNKKYGAINEKGDVVVPLVYDELQNFKNVNEPGNEKYIALAKRDGKAGYINEKGEAVVPFLYESGHLFSEYNASGNAPKIAAVKQNGKWGYIDQAGNVKVPIDYDMVKEFQTIDVSGQIHFIAAVRRDGRWGFGDAAGKIAIPLRYEHVGLFYRRGNLNIARVKSGSEWVYIDEKGNQIDWDWDVDFSRNTGTVGQGKAGDTGSAKSAKHASGERVSLWDAGRKTEVTLLQRDDKWGIVSDQGKTLVPFRYDEIGAFISIYGKPGTGCALPHIVKVRLDGKWGYADMCGNEYVPTVYDELPDTLPTSLQFYRIKKDGKYGYLGRTGIEIVPAKYDEAPAYLQSSGQNDIMRRVKAGGLYGYISISTGGEVIPLRFEYAPEYFTGEKARVKLNGKWGYIDKTGNELGSFSREDDPCIFEKSSGESYLFNDQAVIRAKPDAASDILATPAPGEKVLIGSRTDVEFSTGNETDFWYKAASGGKKGYVWGGDIADSYYWITVKGKKVQILILNRTNGMDRCYAPTFRIRMISDGRILSEFSGHPFVWGTVSDVKSVEYVRMEGFSAPLKLLRIKYSVKGYKDTYARSGTGEVYFYIGDGELKKVLELGDASGWNGGVPAGFSTDVQYADQTGRIDTLKITVKASAALVFGKVFNEYTRKWDWEKKTFGGE